MDPKRAAKAILLMFEMFSIDGDSTDSWLAELRIGGFDDIADAIDAEINAKKD